MSFFSLVVAFDFVQSLLLNSVFNLKLVSLQNSNPEDNHFHLKS